MAREMSASVEAAPSQAKPLWLLGKRRDLAIVGIPMLLVSFAVIAESIGPETAQVESNRLAMWMATNVLGNGTHVALTFLMFFLRPETMRSTPTLRAQVYAGIGVMSAVSFGFLALHWWEPQASISARATIFAIFGTHHTLSQNKGWWSLHLLRERQAGRTPPTLEGMLMKVLVPLNLSLILVRYFFIPTEAGSTEAFINVGQVALLPFASMAVLLGAWLIFWGLVLRTASRSANQAKLLYLCAVAMAVVLSVLAPTWGAVLFAGMHGLEYYFLSARLLEQRPGDVKTVHPRWIWPLMILTMLPLALIGLIQLLRTQAGFEAVFSSFATTWPWQVLVTASTACVLAHYWADALIYRFRVQGVRTVMLNRLSL